MRNWWRLSLCRCHIRGCYAGESFMAFVLEVLPGSRGERHRASHERGVLVLRDDLRGWVQGIVVLGRRGSSASINTGTREGGICLVFLFFVLAVLVEGIGAECSCREATCSCCRGGHPIAVVGWLTLALGKGWVLLLRLLLALIKGSILLLRLLLRCRLGGS